jgi:hypothetical protein
LSVITGGVGAALAFTGQATVVPPFAGIETTIGFVTILSVVGTAHRPAVGVKV